jgi:hypothetical protein
MVEKKYGLNYSQIWCYTAIKSQIDREGKGKKKGGMGNFIKCGLRIDGRWSLADGRYAIKGSRIVGYNQVIKQKSRMKGHPAFGKFKRQSFF